MLKKESMEYHLGIIQADISGGMLDQRKSILMGSSRIDHTNASFDSRDIPAKANEVTGKAVQRPSQRPQIDDAHSYIDSKLEETKTMNGTDQRFWDDVEKIEKSSLGVRQRNNKT